jgi:hypothetical protein
MTQMPFLFASFECPDSDGMIALLEPIQFGEQP